MPIRIGINENVFLDKISLDDKNVLEIVFEEANKEKPVSHFANVAGDEVVETSSMGIKLFPPLPPKKEDMTAEKKVELVMMDINRTKGVLRHLMLGYLTAADLKGLWTDWCAGLPITEENFDAQILKKEILEGVHKNIARIAIEKLKPFAGKREHAFRLLLVRQSKDKHYATFRGRYIEDNPFWEAMEIPKEGSKLKFTDYEKREGLDNDLPAEKSATADKKDGVTAGGEAPKTAASVFGGS